MAIDADHIVSDWIIETIEVQRQALRLALAIERLGLDSRVSLQDKLDALGDVTMEKQERLQMGMSAVNRTASTISHVLKLCSEQARRIVKNMK